MDLSSNSMKFSSFGLNHFIQMRNDLIEYHRILVYKILNNVDIDRSILGKKNTDLIWKSFI